MRREKLVGRPSKEIEDKLCHSVTIKLKIGDYCDLLERAERMKHQIFDAVKGTILRPKSLDEMRRALALNMAYL